MVGVVLAAIEDDGGSWSAPEIEAETRRHVGRGIVRRVTHRGERARDHARSRQMKGDRRRLRLGDVVADPVFVGTRADAEEQLLGAPVVLVRDLCVRRLERDPTAVVTAGAGCDGSDQGLEEGRTPAHLRSSASSVTERRRTGEQPQGFEPEQLPEGGADEAGVVRPLVGDAQTHGEQPDGSRRDHERRAQGLFPRLAPAHRLRRIPRGPRGGRERRSARVGVGRVRRGLRVGARHHRQQREQQRCGDASRRNCPKNRRHESVSRARCTNWPLPERPGEGRPRVGRLRIGCWIVRCRTRAAGSRRDAHSTPRHIVACPV